MVVAGSPLSQVMVAPTTAKKERAKTPKPQSRCADLDCGSKKIANRTKAKAARRRQPGPGTRPGSHQQLPITIDSDEESDSNQTTNATTQSQSQNLWSGSEVHIRRAATVPIPNKAQDDVDDDDKIKIEFDHTFTWDNDAPATPPPELGRRRHHNKPIPKTASKPAKPIGKPSRSLMSAPASSQCFTFSEIFSAKPSPPATKSFKAQHAKPTKSFDAAGKPRKGHAIKVTKGKAKTSGDINRGMRATSYDREFIVPDEEVILENSDDTYSDSSDNSTSDIDTTDDGTDLAIDMEPEYAYNSDILSSPGSR
ncbi:hypothetical protein SLS59_007800 [Nothophoma quercina]|uniref:Uncharacterized protein n=1 Tax=Nothophoma quercina TaxID=749835 RepID=A0ABR3QX76_9PLEO